MLSTPSDESLSVTEKRVSPATAQQYLLHLLANEMAESRTRVVLVSSNLYKRIKEPSGFCLTYVQLLHCTG